MQDQARVPSRVRAHMATAAITTHPGARAFWQQTAPPRPAAPSAPSQEGQLEVPYLEPIEGGTSFHDYLERLHG